MPPPRPTKHPLLCSVAQPRSSRHCLCRRGCLSPPLCQRTHLPNRPPSRVACTSPTPSPRTADAAPLALAAVAHIRHIRRSASIRRTFRHELNCGIATSNASITAAAAPSTQPRVRVSARRFESCCILHVLVPESSSPMKQLKESMRVTMIKSTKIIL